MIRFFVEKDYELIIKWTEFHKTPCMPLKSISETSFICEDEEGPVSFVSVYTTNSNIAFMENLLTRPHVNKAKRKHYIDAIFKTSVDYCNSNEYILMALCDRDTMGNHLKNNGFKIMQKNLDFYVRSN